MGFLRCYMCKNMCKITAVAEGRTVRVSSNRGHP
ncbi:hypothetical protein IC006_0503 [Sulfuracidifex tepidarius]|uniref:4Fe-4S Mo/W bis-MGD-type domain-containing protein n=1 Tax=Sulfuracidifex tepidarius TaxID=1294262 RepID=A0A510DSQ2_9CREN|nr:hypothetical protein IC006_0503 [Sulfuracidifex tepidarius]BBG25969.1 hypothetical protein IC007_0474 [Sulfuracidifex tepidarius]